MPAPILRGFGDQGRRGINIYIGDVSPSLNDEVAHERSRHCFRRIETTVIPWCVAIYL